jgi:hypothetical protein
VAGSGTVIPIRTHNGMVTGNEIIKGVNTKKVIGKKIIKDPDG